MKKINYSKHIIKKITTKKASIGIIGLGYVGLPLSILCVKKGFKVFGFDIDKSKINKINSKVSYIERIKNKDIEILNKKGSFSSKFNNVSKCDIIILCVPTPLKKNKPYINHIKSTIKSVKKFSIIIVSISGGVEIKTWVDSFKSSLILGSKLLLFNK